MIAAVIVLAVGYVVLAFAALGLVTAQRRAEERWRLERRELVNRVVARHTGEVLALDRDTQPRPAREPREPVLIEGLA